MGPWGWRVLGAAVRGTEGAGAYSWGEAQHGSLPCAPGLHPQECSVQPGGRGGAGGAGAVPGSLRNGGLQGRGSSSPRCYGGGRAKESSPGRGSWCPLPCHSLHPAFGPRAVSLPPSSASAPPHPARGSPSPFAPLATPRSWVLGGAWDLAASLPWPPPQGDGRVPFPRPVLPAPCWPGPGDAWARGRRGVRGRGRVPARCARRHCSGLGATGGPLRSHGHG